MPCARVQGPGLYIEYSLAMPSSGPLTNPGRHGEELRFSDFTVPKGQGIQNTADRNVEAYYL